MLKGLDPRLNADVLYCLRAMGHGDTLAIVDTNFPAESVARQTVHGALLRMENLTTAQVLEIVLTLYPLDPMGDGAAARMAPVDDPDHLPPAQAELQPVIDAAEGTGFPMAAVERFAFYDRARACFAIIQSGDARPYGNVILRKGIVTAP
ncbi:RbsD/FucU domain-containing protein [Gymnodinialimonas sp. 2305UL16-5]